MRLSWAALLFVLIALPGCTGARLRQRTTNLGSTLPALQYQQVLDNLAAFSANPSALPWHISLREGTTQITDSISGGALVDIDLGATEPQLFGTRTAVAQWGMSPVIEPTALRLLRIAYQRAQGQDKMPSPEFLDELAHELKGQIADNADIQQETAAFFAAQYPSRDHSPHALDRAVVSTNDERFFTDPRSPIEERSPLARDTSRQVEIILRELAAIRPGWYRTGRKRDVPRDACFVGHSGSCYVWVEADGREALTEFTLTVLRLSEIIKETQTLISPGSVKFSPGDRGG
ncbi:hypothetical protein TA3x_003135 [Tundrisphaera sp. TA3]|uniref:hypothetical protein n=1 Tax=Tundrisphaera sp. TA3 TaxID=3435775 RepID=UPI003EBD5ECB